MEAHARAPDPLTKDGDMASNWQSWKEDFIIFMKVTGYIDKPNEIRANLLKNRIGKIGIDAIQNMSFDNPQDKDDMDILIKKLEEFFNPPKNEVVERYQFFTKSMKQNESIEQHISILREKAKTCNFNDIADSIIRDKIIFDTHDKILRKKFFEADNLDLQKLIAIYNDYNINTEKMKQVTEENRTESTGCTQKLYPGCTQKLYPSCVQKAPINNVIKKACWRCNHFHPQGKCPAWGSKCTKCGEVNHFTQCCKGPKYKSNNDKVDKNLLNPMQKTKFALKNNDKWNNEADSIVKTVEPMNKMTSLPDIPIVFCAAANSSNDTTSDFVILDACNTSPGLRYNNTMSQSTYLPKNTQYNYSYVDGAKPEWITTDVHNKHEKVRSKTTYATGTSQRSHNPPRNTSACKNASHNAKFKSDRKKKPDEDTCVLS